MSCAVSVDFTVNKPKTDLTLSVARFRISSSHHTSCPVGNARTYDAKAPIVGHGRH